MTLKLDLGCGPHPKEGFVGLDQFTFGAEGVIQVNLSVIPWVFGVAAIGDVELEPHGYDYYKLPDSCVDEAHSSHFLEHLQYGAGSDNGRVNFINELYRVLKNGATAQVTVPHWCSNRAWGDPTHAPMPVCEMMHYYLSKEWRDKNAPHSDARVNPGMYNCNFECTWGYSVREDLQVKNQEQQMFALANYKEAAQDLVANWIARKPEEAPQSVPTSNVLSVKPKKGKKAR